MEYEIDILDDIEEEDDYDDDNEDYDMEDLSDLDIHPQEERKMEYIPLKEKI